MVSRNLLSFGLTALWSTCMQIAYCDVQVESKKVQGHELTLYKSLDHCVKFQASSPNEGDPEVELAIPAAFTITKQTIDGLAIVDGKNVGGTLNQHLGGVAVFLDGDYDIISTRELTPKVINDLQTAGGSLFQQFQLVENSLPKTFKDRVTYKRRALVVFSTGAKAVIQSKEKLTLNQFAQDLRAIGVRDAVYAPAGDGGWLRNGIKTINICVVPSPDIVPSNWVVVNNAPAKSNHPVKDWLLKQRIRK